MYHNSYGFCSVGWTEQDIGIIKKAFFWFIIFQQFIDLTITQFIKEGIDTQNNNVKFLIVQLVNYD